ncbi:lectin receptor kinase [Cucumis melo var. makuwa]|uniref:Lectin receptor kinase n=1 Tax=Cucumis melo var. makuwa TaxID=1194695 RepID=A0A5D3DZJ9_CUCMM|nr:lectin receptor kinase [Cucumis melo var. makuwa]TYK28888.1 lectin receptor kinase [Cucumis melo var. makuwa]
MREASNIEQGNESCQKVEELVPIIKANKDGNVVNIEDEEEDKDVLGGSMKTTTITAKEDGETQKKVVDKATQDQEKEFGTLLMACTNSEWNKDDTWYLDTGANNNMCGVRSMLVELDESMSANVAFGDESKVEVKGRAAQEKQGVKLKNSKALEHTNVCELIKLSSLGKISYFLPFIYDFSRKAWVYFLKHKSEVLENFKKFKSLVEKGRGLVIKVMRFDCGREFTSKEFQKYKKDNPKSDVVLKEEVEWDWRRYVKDYNFLSTLKKMIWSKQVVCKQERSLLLPSSSQEDESSRESVQCFRSLKELYQMTKNQDNLSLFCLFANFEKNARGEVERYKARSMAKGYSQRAGIDYEGISSLLARLEYVRLMISLADQNSWRIHQMDVNSAFLNGVLKEEVYIEQTQSYIVGKEDKVLELKKALYGLKQAPGARIPPIDKYVNQRNFIKCPHEYGLNIKDQINDVLIMCLYVDDLIFTGCSPSMFNKFKEDMTNEFEMTNVMLKYYYLGIEVKQEDKGMFIMQEAYAKEVIKKFKMDDFNSLNMPVEFGIQLSHCEEENKCGSNTL